MDWLNPAIALITPWLQQGVALLGKVPLGLLGVVVLVLVWITVLRLTTVSLLLAGLAAALAIDLWLTMGHGWSQWLAVPIALISAILACQVCAMAFLVRLVLAILTWPPCIWILWHSTRAALDGWWALGLATLAAWAIGSLLHRFVTGEHRPPSHLAADLVAELRGD
jgi:hypothetical protein